MGQAVSFLAGFHTPSRNSGANLPGGFTDGCIGQAGCSQKCFLVFYRWLSACASLHYSYFDSLWMTIVVAGFTLMQSCRMSSHVRHASARSEHCTENTAQVLTIQEVIVCLSTWTRTVCTLQGWANMLAFPFFFFIQCATQGLQLVVPYGTAYFSYLD